MTKHINYRENLSLEELDWSPGEVMAFDNTDFEWPQPFLIAIPKEINRGYDKSNGGMRLIYWANDGEREEWTLYADGKLLELWSPNHKKGHKVPNFRLIKDGYPHGNGYVIEEAMSGEDEIKQHLVNDKHGLDFYAEFFQRSKFQKFIDKVSLRPHLPI